MSYISCLQLSDLHFQSGENYEQRKILQKLLLSIEKEKFIPNLVIITGDLSTKGKEEEFNEAIKFLDELIRITGIEKKYIFIVPGNHDINRTKISESLKPDFTKQTDVHKFLGDEKAKEFVFSKFEDYANFIKEFYNNERIFDHNDNYYLSKIIQIGNINIGVIGLNSSWMSESDKDRNKLIIGERQITKALEKLDREKEENHIANIDIKIAIFHHPLDWLEDFDRNCVEPLLIQNFDIIQHGHQHLCRLNFWANPYAGTTIISGGACYDAARYKKEECHSLSYELPLSYNYLTFDIDKGKGFYILGNIHHQKEVFGLKII